MKKVKVTGAYVDGKGPGSTLSVDDKMADYLERLGYAKIIEVEEKKTPKKSDSAKESKPKSKPKGKEKK